MSRDSRSRSRSPLQASDDESNSRRTRSKKVKKGSETNTALGCRAYVSNIPLHFNQHKLKDFFCSEVGDVAYVEMFRNDTGPGQSSAVVEFKNREMVEKAIEKFHRKKIGGRKLIVKQFR